MQAQPFFVFVPLPNWPLKFNPQHLTAPAVVTAQVWPNHPAATAATALVSPLTSTGVLLQA
jgi:hypothetical protein